MIFLLKAAVSLGVVVILGSLAGQVLYAWTGSRLVSIGGGVLAAIYVFLAAGRRGTHEPSVLHGRSVKKVKVP